MAWNFLFILLVALVATCSTDKTALFYHIFVGKHGLEHTQGIVRNQLDQIENKTKFEIYPTIVGAKDFSFNFSHSKPIHTDHGNEGLTLARIWNYCRSSGNQFQTVVYLHTKGSYSNNPRNTKLRQFLTYGAVSQQCINSLDRLKSKKITAEHCTVCSSRMSPLPHPHTPGNMWAASCSYVRNLIDPLQFPLLMKQFDASENACRGTGRYAFEHWIHSHPTDMPCDLLADPIYVWNYDHTPDTPFPMDYKSAPRFKLDTYRISNLCPGYGVLAERITEYRILYNLTPQKDWWGWRVY